MDDLYLEIRRYISPITAENIYSINSEFCIEDGFLPQKEAIKEIEPKLYSTYYRFINMIDSKRTITESFIDSLIPDVAGCITYYIASTQMFPTANKRTAAVAAELFLFINGKHLSYETLVEHGHNGLVDLLSNIGNQKIGIEESINWYTQHCVNSSELLERG